MYKDPDESEFRTVVLEPLQTPLIEWKHKNMCHMITKKVYITLKKNFFFDNMFQKCKRTVKDCALYNLLKALKKHTHKYFGRETI